MVLDYKAVDAIPDKIQSLLKEHGIHKANIIRSRLAIESVLLEIADHYECKKEITISIGSRFGSRYFIIRYEGDAYNPMEDIASTGFSEMLLDRLSLKPI